MGPINGMGEFLVVLSVLAVIGVVLGIWKLIELFVWLCNHVQIT